MNYKEFKDQVHDYLTQYFNEIHRNKSYNLSLSSNNCVLYPNIILFTRCQEQNYYVVELLGCSDKPANLKIIEHKEKSIYQYLNQFNNRKPKAAFYIKHKFEVSDINLSTEVELNHIKKRFPSINLDKFRPTINCPDCEGSVIDFGENFVSLMLNNVLIVNSLESKYRCKNILALYIINASAQSHDLKNIFSIKSSTKPHGIYFLTRKEKYTLALAGQMQNIYLTPNIHETHIGIFLKKNPIIIKRAFNTEKFLCDIKLEWQNKSTDEPIIPDILIRRPDGYYDICDLKLPLNNKQKLTKNARKRRSFISLVEEGLAQLAHYEEYFKSPNNAQYALKRYDIKVKEPNLYLIIGTWENLHPQEAIEASRKNSKNLIIMDYDTLCSNFILSKINN